MCSKHCYVSMICRKMTQVKFTRHGKPMDRSVRLFFQATREAGWGLYRLEYCSKGFVVFRFDDRNVHSLFV